MKTDDLISALASQATPIQPLPAPWVRQVGWLVVAMASLAFGTVALGTRADLAEVSRQPWFAWNLALVVGVVAFASGGSLVLAVPGASHAGLLRTLSLTLCGAWAATLVVNIVRAGRGFEAVSDWPVCFAIVTAVGVPPAAWLVALVRRAAPLQYAWTAGLALVAALAVGAAAIQLICPQNDPAHALLGHLAPVFALSGFGAWAGRRLLA